MALPDPITVAAKTPNPEIKLGTVLFDGYGSTRLDLNKGGYRSVINHSKSKQGSKHYLQLLLSKNATDPYSGLVREMTASASFTINRPLFGFSDEDMIALAQAHFDLIQDSEVTVQKLLQFQS